MHVFLKLGDHRSEVQNELEVRSARLSHIGKREVVSKPLAGIGPNGERRKFVRTRNFFHRDSSEKNDAG